MQRIWIRYGISAAMAVGLTALIGTSARAEITEGSWEAGGGLTYSVYDNSSTLEQTEAFGVRGAYYFLPRHGLEVELDFASTESNTAGSDVKFDVNKLGVSYVHNFELRTKEKFSPFLLAGAGKIMVDDGVNDDAATFLRLGGGVRYALTSHWALRFDGRLYRWRGDKVVTPREAFFSFDMTVGVSYLFGGSQ